MFINFIAEAITTVKTIVKRFKAVLFKDGLLCQFRSLLKVQKQVFLDDLKAKHQFMEKRQTFHCLNF